MTFTAATLMYRGTPGMRPVRRKRGEASSRAAAWKVAAGAVRVVLAPGAKKRSLEYTMV